MTLRPPAFVRAALCVLPLSVLLACASESTSEPEATATSDEALRSGEAPKCSTTNPHAYVVPIDGWDAADLADLEKHGCKPPFQYITGAEAGILGGIMSACEDTPTAHAFVAQRTGLPRAWAPVGFCDAALRPLPKGQRYVVWSWSIGPNCSGCKDNGHTTW
jgi:hypothetical protein